MSGISAIPQIVKAVPQFVVGFNFPRPSVEINRVAFNDWINISYNAGVWSQCICLYDNKDEYIYMLDQIAGADIFDNPDAGLSLSLITKVVLLGNQIEIKTVGPSFCVSGRDLIVTKQLYELIKSSDLIRDKKISNGKKRGRSVHEEPQQQPTMKKRKIVREKSNKEIENKKTKEKKSGLRVRVSPSEKQKIKLKIKQQLQRFGDEGLSEFKCNLLTSQKNQNRNLKINYHFDDNSKAQMKTFVVQRWNIVQSIINIKFIYFTEVLADIYKVEIGSNDIQNFRRWTRSK